MEKESSDKTLDSADPWEYLAEVIESADINELKKYLSSLSSVDAVLAISRLSLEQQKKMFVLLEPEDAAQLIAELPDSGVVDIIEDLNPAEATPIVEEMRSDFQADLLGQLDKEDADAILDTMESEKANELRTLMAYPEDTAGGLMITEYLAYDQKLLVKDVLEDMRAHAATYSDYDIQYAYITAQEGKLIGVLRLRDLLLSPRDKPVRKLMIANPLKLDVTASVQELHRFFNLHTFFGAPVVDKSGRLIGVVRRASVEEETQKSSTKTFLNFSGIIGGEEFRTMPFIPRSGRRLSWLSINIILNIIAASVIALYQDTLEKAIVLAVFLPIISDMSGCSGNQAVAVSIRELSLGLIRPRELWRVLAKESLIGLANGIVLGLLLAGAAILWKGNAYLGVVVGGALAANTLVAVCLGGAIPLVLKGMKMDPALASGPILTTVTDMCGFFFVLSFASNLMPLLNG
jgi:magnesium transporter